MSRSIIVFVCISCLYVWCCIVNPERKRSIGIGKLKRMSHCLFICSLKKVREKSREIRVKFINAQWLKLTVYNSSINTFQFQLKESTLVSGCIYKQNYNVLNAVSFLRTGSCVFTKFHVDPFKKGEFKILLKLFYFMDQNISTILLWNHQIFEGPY